MLNTNDINTVMNQCRVELTGVSDALLKSAMFEVMDEFFRDTMSWKEQITINVVPIDSTPQTPEDWQQLLTYSLVPEEGQIIGLDGVVNTNGSYVPALMPDTSSVLLKYAPNEAQQYFVCVFKNVGLPLDGRGYPVAPDWVLQKWHLAIKSGILGTIKNQSNKSFSDSSGALYHLKKFRQYIQNARTAILRANTRGAQAWRYPQTFRSISQKGGVPVYGIGNDWSG